MSFFGSKEEAKKNCNEASRIPDAGSTSPVHNGGSDPGGAPIKGPTEFTQERTRNTFAKGDASRKMRRSIDPE